MYYEFDSQPVQAISPLAFSGGREYQQGFLAALKNKEIPVTDPRVLMGLATQATGHVPTREDYLISSWRLVPLTADLADSIRSPATIKRFVGTKKSFLKEAQDAGTPQSQYLSLAKYAMSVEHLAIALLDPDTGRPSMSEKYFWHAATGLDCAVLRRRHEAWNGLATDIATRETLSLAEVSKGLLRAGKIKDSDPRLSISEENVRLHTNAIPSVKFISYVNDLCWKNIGAVQSKPESRFSRRSILQDFKEIPSRPDRAGDPVSKNRWQSRVMSTFARIGERMALNLDSQGEEKRPTVTSLLDATASCIDRSNVFEHRAIASELTNGTRKVVPFPGRGKNQRQNERG